MWHSNKMETVCTKIREECIRINENKFTLVIILTYLKQGPEFVESALKYIQSLNIEDPVNKEAALKFLHLYINPDILYKKALMTYDLELALMTAQITSKDPKEYIAYLEKLESLEVPYRHFIIEKDLKNYLIALKHLINCGVEHEQECVEFIKTRDLCKEALDLIPKHSEKL
ncbi:Elongator complex protein 1 [Thelohanellus kitauei]|uniref:Elongator complex protein 1 n=1 Tax=Thelohanellus kitauei TaxID=669202 RepID=A0A0C2J5Y2_THEKT|nr:Elongator complex protein 1 [Thelohanellus kitauei]